ncbi:MAG: hypothetical protein Q7K26_06190 [bacterium]|nr:hypothetical protein [bacterium]
MSDHEADYEDDELSIEDVNLTIPVRSQKISDLDLMVHSDAIEAIKIIVRSNHDASINNKESALLLSDIPTQLGIHMEEMQEKFFNELDRTLDPRSEDSIIVQMKLFADALTKDADENIRESSTSHLESVRDEGNRQFGRLAALSDKIESEIAGALKQNAEATKAIFELVSSLASREAALKTAESAFNTERQKFVTESGNSVSKPRGFWAELIGTNPK